MAADFTANELEAYLDEALSVERMAEIEIALRKRPELLRRLAAIHARRDIGVHTLAEIWRRSQIGVPTREELSNYVRGLLPKEHAAYIRFRVETLKCRLTIANLRDIEAQRREADAKAAARRRKFFDFSVRHLKD